MKKPPVTDHAIVRYLERVCGMDLNGVRRKIFRATKNAIRSGATKITVDGVEYRIADGRVVTLVSAGQKAEPAKAFKKWDQSGKKECDDGQSLPVQLGTTRETK